MPVDGAARPGTFLVPASPIRMKRELTFTPRPWHELRTPEKGGDERIVRHALGFAVVSQISRDEVAHLARLARLALAEDELDSFAGQLDAILSHVSQIQAVDVAGVDPTGNPLKDVNVFRPDEVEPCLTQEEALAEAPKAVDGRFGVPRILGEAE
jgi:aspartyl-tRNA(Asn)/glutamyl-tRNA(Gln) amidotransferase subunit C